jgi:hypothetical protein
MTVIHIFPLGHLFLCFLRIAIRNPYNSDEIDKFDAAKSAGVVFLFLLTGFYTTTIMAHKV